MAAATGGASGATLPLNRSWTGSEGLMRSRKGSEDDMRRVLSFRRIPSTIEIKSLIETAIPLVGDSSPTSPAEGGSGSPLGGSTRTHSLAHGK